MKRFKYRLETVLDYKNQILDNLKTEHAVIIQNVNRKQEEIKGLHNELAGFENEFDRAKETGIAIENYRLFDMCIGRMEEIIDQEKERLKVLRKQEEEKKQQESSRNIKKQTQRLTKHLLRNLSQAMRFDFGISIEADKK